MFKVGDAVRVKAGSPVIEETNTSHHPWRRSFGKKLTIEGISKADRLTWAEVTIDVFSCDYLEHWNDAEEWDGSKWVPKKKVEEAKPCVVSGPYGYMKMKSTNEAFRYAEEWANKYPGTEYVVYQEKGSRKVEKKTNAEMLAEQMRSAPERSISVKGYGKFWLDHLDVKAEGNVVTAIYHIRP